jgi:hypothetical protein
MPKVGVENVVLRYGLILFVFCVENTAVTLDHNWRWLHKVNDYVNCYTGRIKQ